MSRTVMIVDDSSSVRILLRLALEKAGYSVVEAEDGQVALKLLDGRPVDAIVSDLSMPHMDGMDFIKDVRNSARYRDVPVLVLTTDTRPDIKFSTRVQGAQAFMNKPCQPTMLVEAVNRLCERAARPANTPRANPAAA